MNEDDSLQVQPMAFTGICLYVFQIHCAVFRAVFKANQQVESCVNLEVHHHNKMCLLDVVCGCNMILVTVNGAISKNYNTFMRNV